MRLKHYLFHPVFKAYVALITVPVMGACFLALLIMAGPLSDTAVMLKTPQWGIFLIDLGQLLFCVLYGAFFYTGWLLALHHLETILAERSIK